MQVNAKNKATKTKQLNRNKQKSMQLIGNLKLTLSYADMHAFF